MGDINWNKALEDVVDALRDAVTEQRRIADLLEEQNDLLARKKNGSKEDSAPRDIVGNAAREYLYGERSRGR